MKRLILVVSIMALCAVPAFASVQNVKVSGDIDTTWLYRNNFDLGAAQSSINASIGSNSQNVFLTQTRLRVAADLTDNVSAVVGLINERPWNVNSGSSTDIDLNIANVTLKEFLYSPLTLVVGRQDWRYGNSFIFDSTGTNNVAPTDSGIRSVANDLTKQTALDAIRAILDYKPLTIEAFYSKLSAGSTLTAANGYSSYDDADLFGINANYELGDKMGSVAEAYFYAKHDRTPSVVSAGGNTQTTKTDSIYVPGLRVSTNPVKGVNLQGEVAWQRGTKVVSSTAATSGIQRDAMAAQVIASWEVPALEEYHPMMQYVYTYVSGDQNPANFPAAGSPSPASRDKWTAWDPFFEAQGSGTIYNTIFNLTNAHIHSVSLSAKPMEDLTTKVMWTGLWLAKDSTTPPYTTLTLVQPDGTTPAPFVNNGKSSLGNEIDVMADYAYTEDVTIGANLGWYIPGDFFKTINEKVAQQAIVHMNVNF